MLLLTTDKLIFNRAHFTWEQINNQGVSFNVSMKLSLSYNFETSQFGVIYTLTTSGIIFTCCVSPLNVRASWTSVRTSAHTFLTLARRRRYFRLHVGCEIVPQFFVALDLPIWKVAVSLRSSVSNSRRSGTVVKKRTLITIVLHSHTRLNRTDDHRDRPQRRCKSVKEERCGVLFT